MASDQIEALVTRLGDRDGGVRQRARETLAAIGLVNMGNRSLPYVLQALTERAESKGLREASHHAFRDLSDRNGVIRGILEPVLEVLGDTDAIGVIYARAEVAPRELRTLRGD